jgi:hypothetical protein
MWACAFYSKEKKSAPAWRVRNGFAHTSARPHTGGRATTCSLASQEARLLIVASQAHTGDDVQLAPDRVAHECVCVRVRACTYSLPYPYPRRHKKGYTYPCTRVPCPVIPLHHPSLMFLQVYPVTPIEGKEVTVLLISRRNLV